MLAGIEAPRHDCPLARRRLCGTGPPDAQDTMTTRLLTRRPSATMADAELTFLGGEPIDVARAGVQHARYRAAFAATGVVPIDLPALDACPDATFVEDTLLALPELFVLCRPGAVSRQPEVASIAAALPDDRPVRHIEAPATIDGGDVLRIDRTLYVGLSTRTNAAALAQLETHVAPFGYRVIAVRVPGALHLKTAVTAPRPGLLVMNRGWVDADAFTGFRIIDVAPGEPFAGNTLVVGGQVFVQAAHAGTAARLLEAGIPTTPLDISEFAKAEAGLTCMSVVVPPAA